MTQDSGFKRHVRDRAKRTGESYSTARVHLRRRSEAIDEELVTRTAAPIVRRMHDTDPEVRRAVVPNLNREQGSLVAFWILFTHKDDGLTGLVRAHPHRVIDPDFWTLIDTGLREHDALLRVLARLRGELASGPDLYELDPAVMSELDAEFKVVMPGSLRRMADQIRAHPERFAAAEAASR